VPPYEHAGERRDRRIEDERIARLESEVDRVSKELSTQDKTLALATRDVAALVEELTRLRHTIEISMTTFVLACGAVVGSLAAAGKL
jgi:cob(I)alamin adenosyltransferase